jgi:thiol-disulfide isomerase/thioredoxin
MDSVSARLLLLVVVLVAGSAVGVWCRWRDGRSREVSTGPVLTADDVGSPLGRAGTVLQFSSAMCAPCRATYRVLSALVPTLEDVAHLDLDVERHLDLVRRLDVLRTPTVLVLDRAGQVVGRLSGVPTPAQAREALHVLDPC